MRLIRSRAVVLALLATALTPSAPAVAQTFTPGDVVIATSRFDPMATPTTEANIAVYDPSGPLKRMLNTHPELFFDDFLTRGTQLIAVVARPYEISPAGALTLVPITTARSTGRALADDASGALYVGYTDAIERYAPSGVRTAEITGFAVRSLDVASDQCTVYYAASIPDRIGRYNVCTGEHTPTLATFGSPVGTVRVLPDGSLLVGTSTETVRLSPTGTLLRTYPFAGRFALDETGTTFWSRIATAVRRIDLATGAVLTTLTPPAGAEFGAIGVIGGFRAAAVAPAAIPALSVWVLGALGVVLVFFAIRATA